MVGDFDLKKRTVAITLLFCVVIIASAIAVIATSASPGSASSFTLSASGTAFDPASQKTVALTLYATGTVAGNPKSTITLQVKSGSINVAGFATLSISPGSGTIKTSSSSVKLTLITSQSVYGGRSSPWSFDGTAASSVSNTIPITISAVSEVLPFQGNPTLKDLSLTGTITLNSCPLVLFVVT